MCDIAHRASERTANLQNHWRLLWYTIHNAVKASEHEVLTTTWNGHDQWLRKDAVAELQEKHVMVMVMAMAVVMTIIVIIMMLEL